MGERGAAVRGLMIVFHQLPRPNPGPRILNWLLRKLTACMIRFVKEKRMFASAHKEIALNQTR